MEFAVQRMLYHARQMTQTSCAGQTLIMVGNLMTSPFLNTAIKSDKTIRDGTDLRANSIERKILIGPIFNKTESAVERWH